MQSGIADTMVRELPRPLIDGMVAGAQLATVPAVEYLARAIREQRVSDGYRRLLRAIVDEAWVPNES